MPLIIICVVSSPVFNPISVETSSNGRVNQTLPPVSFPFAHPERSSPPAQQENGLQLRAKLASTVAPMCQLHDTPPAQRIILRYAITFQPCNPSSMPYTFVATVARALSSA